METPVMPRPTGTATLLFVFAAIALAAVGSALFVLFGGAIPDWALANAAQEKTPARPHQLSLRLQQPVNLDKGIDPSTPLKDALEFLSDRYDLTIIVDEQAFLEIGVQRAEEQPVQLPKMVGVTMATVLRLLLSQIKGDEYHGTYAIRDDHLLITTTLRASTAETWTADSGTPAPTIDVDCVQKPLQDVLYELRDLSRMNILVDARVADKARKPITATLTKVPADTAVRLLADMGDLRMVAIDNVLYVTSIDNAKELQAQQEARARQRQAKKSGEAANGPKQDGPTPAPQSSGRQSRLGFLCRRAIC
jgi:hypothetical protein